MKSTLLAVAVAGVLASGGAAAGTTVQVNHAEAAIVPVQYSEYRGDDHNASVDQREAHLRARIERGLSDGRITNREARGLYRQLANVEARERTYKADGRLTYREEAELNRRLDRLAENVRIQLRDEDRRYSYAQ